MTRSNGACSGAPKPPSAQITRTASKPAAARLARALLTSSASMSTVVTLPSGPVTIDMTAAL